MTIFDALRARADGDRDACLARVARQRPGRPPLCVALAALVAVPVALALALPLALAALAARCLCCRPAPRGRGTLDCEATAAVTAAQAPFPPRAARPVDVVVLGATGLAGGLLAEFLLAEHPDKRIALAGRSRAKLAAVRARLGAADAPLIVADATDLQSLFDLCRQVQVVASTVGPYKRFGNLLYHACAHSGTAYADITGEADWVRHMAKIYDPVARRTGASLLSFCGVDSVPSEMGAIEACRRFRSAHGGAEPTHVETVVTRFKGGIPAGTLETVAGVVDGTDTLQRRPAGSGRGTARPKRGRTTIAGVLGGPSRSRAFQQWTTPFIMAHVNANTVRTANARVGFAPGGITYTERRGWPDLSAAVTDYATMACALPFVALPLLRRCGRALGALPAAGAGAAAYSEKVMLTGSVAFLVAASGKDASGGAAVSALRVSGLGDAGGAFTAVCHGTIAALLCDAEAKIPAGAGLTPAATLGEALPAALQATGLVFIESLAADDAVLRR
jgi:short subunit dehydrogenase-like uncharacterized protein